MTTFSHSYVIDSRHKDDASYAEYMERNARREVADGLLANLIEGGSIVALERIESEEPRHDYVGGEMKLERLKKVTHVIRIQPYGRDRYKEIADDLARHLTLMETMDAMAWVTIRAVLLNQLMEMKG